MIITDKRSGSSYATDIGGKDEKVSELDTIRNNRSNEGTRILPSTLIRSIEVFKEILLSYCYTNFGLNVY
jgi:hypothetical protein